MATGTASLATASAPVRYNHAGTTSIRVKGVFSGHTLSDQILLAKLPLGALVTHLNGIFGTGNADSVIKLGWKGSQSGQASDETDFGTHTSSSTDATTNFALDTEDLGPVLVTFTDTSGLPFAYLFATCSVGSFSDTFTLDIALQFHMAHNEFAF